jgi:hypothetical protein
MFYVLVLACCSGLYSNPAGGRAGRLVGLGLLEHTQARVTYLADFHGFGERRRGHRQWPSCAG